MLTDSTLTGDVVQSCFEEADPASGFEPLPRFSPASHVTTPPSSPLPALFPLSHDASLPAYPLRAFSPPTHDVSSRTSPLRTFPLPDYTASSPNHDASSPDHDAFSPNHSLRAASSPTVKNDHLVGGQTHGSHPGDSTEDQEEYATSHTSREVKDMNNWAGSQLYADILDELDILSPAAASLLTRVLKLVKEHVSLLFYCLDSFAHSVV